MKLTINNEKTALRITTALEDQKLGENQYVNPLIKENESLRSLLHILDSHKNEVQRSKNQFY